MNLGSLFWTGRLEPQSFWKEAKEETQTTEMGEAQGFEQRNRRPRVRIPSVPYQLGACTQLLVYLGVGFYLCEKWGCPDNGPDKEGNSKYNNAWKECFNRQIL